MNLSIAITETRFNASKFAFIWCCFFFFHLPKERHSFLSLPISSHFFYIVEIPIVDATPDAGQRRNKLFFYAGPLPEQGELARWRMVAYENGNNNKTLTFSSMELSIVWCLICMNSNII